MTSQSILFDCYKLMVGYKMPCTHPISFTIHNPGIYALCGPNGSGKSTFLKTLVGLMQPISGKFSSDSSRKSTYVPQVHTVNQYFHLSVYDFILQGYGPKFKVTEKTIDNVKNLASTWQLVENMEKCFHELSNGQKTRAMIVRALISKPNTLFLDEPLASLDPCCQEQLMHTLSQLASEGACIFLADHHLERYQHLLTGRLTFEKRHDDPLTLVSMS